MKDLRTTPPLFIQSAFPRLSEWFAPYYELSRLCLFPGVPSYLFWPCAWALTVGATKAHLPPLALARLLAQAFVEATIAHGAGCTVDDIFDHSIDSKYERTSKRPLAAGRISMSAAWSFYALQVAVCVALYFTPQQPVFYLRLAGLVVQGMYPLTKRVTYWPQAYLGVAVTWNLLPSWLLFDQPPIELLVLALAASSCWMLVADTTYAIIDREEDLKTGVKSTAVLFGSWVKPILFGVTALFVLGLGYVGYANGQGGWVAAGLVGAGGHVGWHLWRLEVGSRESCWRKFLVFVNAGCILWIGLLVEYLMEMAK